MFLVVYYAADSEGEQEWVEEALFHGGDAFDYAHELSGYMGVVAVHPISHDQYVKREWGTASAIFVHGIRYNLDAAQFRKEE